MRSRRLAWIGCGSTFANAVVMLSLGSSRRANILGMSVAFVLFSVLSGCYRDREVRHEDRVERHDDKVERKEEKKQEKYDEHH
ncbi:MAG: hypothetical protein ABI421_12190 [Polyangiaceae bacterium]